MWHFPFFTSVLQSDREELRGDFSPQLSSSFTTTYLSDQYWACIYSQLTWLKLKLEYDYIIIIIIIMM